MLKTIKKQRGQVFTQSQKQAIKQGTSMRRHGKTSKVLAMLSQSVGSN